MNFVDVASAEINTRYRSIYFAYSHSIIQRTLAFIQHTQDVFETIYEYLFHPARNSVP